MYMSYMCRPDGPRFFPLLRIKFSSIKSLLDCVQSMIHVLGWTTLRVNKLRYEFNLAIFLGNKINFKRIYVSLIKKKPDYYLVLIPLE